MTRRRRCTDVVSVTIDVSYSQFNACNQITECNANCVITCYKVPENVILVFLDHCTLQVFLSIVFYETIKITWKCSIALTAISNSFHVAHFNSFCYFYFRLFSVILSCRVLRATTRLLNLTFIYVSCTNFLHWGVP